MELIDTLQTLLSTTEQAIRQASSSAELETLEIRFLGRKGELTQLLRGLADLKDEERRQAGQTANEIKQKLEQTFAAARERLAEVSIRERLLSEREDVTEPGFKPPPGHTHLVSQAIREIADIFERAGFTHYRCPEVEWDRYVFEALNMPKDHPARDEQETFFLDATPSPRDGRMLLTTQATSGTARILAQQELPIRAIHISKTYRREFDITHVPMFHQFDVVHVDRGISIAHLRGVLDYFVKSFFGPTRKIRLRPHHFRFTEPSFEIDISCGVCAGTGFVAAEEKCRTCKRGWLELGGAGMLHPNVLKAAGIDPSVYSGLAFGWGVERTYLMKEGLRLNDLRVFYSNDLRFLQQF